MAGGRRRVAVQFLLPWAAPWIVSFDCKSNVASWTRGGYMRAFMTEEMVFANLDLGDLVFAVVALGQDGKLLKPLIYGTAFCVGPGVFLTAGHVLSNIRDDGGVVGIARVKGEGMGVVAAMNTELLPSHDIGVVLARAPGLTLLDWDAEPRSMLHDVSAVGFPFAVNRVENPPSFKVTLRGFKGHIITRTGLWSVPSSPVGYEVSSTFPKGMSGAPLIDASGPVPNLQVAGVVLGNAEVTAFNEVTRFGIALDIQALSNLRSDVIIGGTFGDLRQKVLTGVNFRFDSALPFLQWQTK